MIRAPLVVLASLFATTGCRKTGAAPKEMTPVATAAAPVAPDANATASIDAGLEGGADAASASSRDVPDPPGMIRIGYGTADAHFDKNTEGPLDVACGAYRIQQAARTAELHVVRGAGNSVVWKESLPPPVGLQTIEPLYCFDLTGDGEPDFAYETYTGGAHCCRVEHVVSLAANAPVRSLLAWDAGDGWIDGPVKLDEGAAWQLVGADLALMEWTSPSSTPELPLVFALSPSAPRGSFVRATRKYPDRARTERAHILAHDGFSAWDRALYRAGSSVLLGDWPEMRAAAEEDLARDDPAHPERVAAQMHELEHVHAKLAHTL